MRLLTVLVGFALVATSCTGGSSVAEEPLGSAEELVTVSEQPAPESTDDADTPPALADTEDFAVVEAELARMTLLIEHCEAGSDMACDVLFMNSADDSPEEDFALRCGGRSDKQVLFCTEGIEHKGRNSYFEEDSEALPAIVTLCEDGDMTACDFLFERSIEGSEYETLGDGCAFRVETALPDCRTAFVEEYGNCPSDLPGGCDDL